MPFVLPQQQATRISWSQTWMSGWQLAPERFPQLCQRFHLPALLYHHPCWSERKHLLFNQPLTAWTDRVTLFQGLSVSMASAPQVYGTHRQIAHTDATATARDVTPHTVSENRQSATKFQIFSSQLPIPFHWQQGWISTSPFLFSDSLYYRHPISACNTNYIQHCNNPPHPSKASL